MASNSYICYSWFQFIALYRRHFCRSSTVVASDPKPLLLFWWRLEAYLKPQVPPNLRAELGQLIGDALYVFVTAATQA